MKNNTPEQKALTAAHYIGVAAGIAALRNDPNRLATKTVGRLTDQERADNAAHMRAIRQAFGNSR